MNDFVPTLNSSGSFEFKKPVSDKLNTQSVFTCKSVRKISELLASGIDVYRDYYVPLNIQLDSYNDDKSSDISVVGLYSDSESWLYVPSSHILSYPDISGVPYRRMALVVNLGPLSESFDLTTLNNLIMDLVKTQIGVEPELRAVSISERAMVKREVHESIEKTRQARIDLNKTTFFELAKLNRMVADLTSKNKVLEEHILKTIGN
jgi:hypothetical protein